MHFATPKTIEPAGIFQSISESDHLGISRRLIKNWHCTIPLNGYFSSSQPKYLYQELMKACGDIVTTISQIFGRTIWQCLIHSGVFVPEVSVVEMFLSNLCETLMFPPTTVVVGLAVSTVLMLLKKLFWTLIRLSAAIALRCWHPWS